MLTSSRWFCQSTDNNQPEQVTSPSVPSTTKFETAIRSNIGNNEDSYDPWAKSLYPKNLENLAVDQHSRSARPKIDPR